MSYEIDQANIVLTGLVDTVNKKCSLHIARLGKKVNDNPFNIKSPYVIEDDMWEDGLCRSCFVNDYLFSFSYDHLNRLELITFGGGDYVRWIRGDNDKIIAYVQVEGETFCLVKVLAGYAIPSDIIESYLTVIVVTVSDDKELRYDEYVEYTLSDDAL